MKTYLCRAEEMLEKSDIIQVGGYLLHNWSLDIEVEDSEIALEFSYTDYEGLIYCFEFTKESILKAEIIGGNTIEAVDSEGEKVEISCFTLERLVL